MALPMNIKPIQMIDGSMAVDTTRVEILPVNSTGVLSFDQGNNVVRFQIPAYPNAWLNPKRTYLSFIGKVVSADGQGKPRFSDNVPVIERLITRVGPTVVEDITDYYALERVMSNFESLAYKESHGFLTGDNRGVLLRDEGSLNEISTEQTGNGITFNKPLISGLLGKEQNAYLPVGLFSGTNGYAMEIEIHLAKNAIACRNDGTASTVSYSISNVKMMLELVHLTPETMAMYNQQVLQNGVSIPIKVYRRHFATLPSGQSGVDINVHDSAQDLEKVITVILPTAKAQTAKDNSANVVALITDANLSGKGGKGSTDKVATYQWRYGTKYYPTKKVQVATDDSNAILLESLSTMDKLHEPAFVMARENKTYKRVFENEFCIVQSFKKWNSRDVYAGLNTTSTASPLQLFLEMSGNTSATYDVLNFVQTNEVITIEQNGLATMTKM